MIVVLIIGVVIIATVGAYSIIKLNKNLDKEHSFYMAFVRENKQKFISFEDSIVKADLPIITLEIGHKSCGFILDSGANCNYIDQSVLDHLFEKDVISYKAGTEIIGVGEPVFSKSCELSFTCNNQSFTEPFQVADISESFATITHESGVEVCGILGNQFFNKFKWVLDFDQLVVWTRQ